MNCERAAKDWAGALQLLQEVERKASKGMLDSSDEEWGASGWRTLWRTLRAIWTNSTKQRNPDSSETRPMTWRTLRGRPQAVSRRRLTCQHQL